MRNLLPFFFFLMSSLLVAQTDSMLFDHSKAIERLENSETELFNELFAEYNRYLIDNPNNLEVLIERLQFVNFAQYDEYEEVNPNQKLFDSLLNHTLSIYPESPPIVLYEAENAWGDSLENIFRKAERLILKNKDWTPKQKSELYAHIARTHYYDDEFVDASKYAEKALSEDSNYVKNIIYCNILLQNKDSLRLKQAILNNIDSSESVWTLKRKADLLIELKSYDDALGLYNFIRSKDSSAIQDDKMAAIFEGVKQFELARTYYLNDTANTWDKSSATLTLFQHDLNYQTAELASQSYNAYRDIGFTQDPLGLYRLHLFFHHPSASWKWRDIGAILLLILLISILVLIPSIWILPVYFIGHHYKVKPDISLGKGWGLKTFWFVSAAYLIASLFSLFPNPEDLNYFFNDSNYYEEDINLTALSNVVFMVVLGLLVLLTLFKKKVAILGSPVVSRQTVFFQTLGYFFLFKLATGIYISIGSKLFGLDLLNNISGIDFLFSSEVEIENLIESYNLWITLLLVAVFVPIYEEIMFRGVILEASSKYLSYKWANILQAFLFACVHGELFLFPVFFAFGIITGNLRKKSGGLWGGIFFHIINNFLAAIIIYGKMDIDLKALIFFGGE